MKTKQMIMLSLIVVWCLSWAGQTFAAEYDPLVKKAQQKLTELGYDPGPADGKIGKKTVAAIKSFQQDNALQVTGELNDLTQKKLGIAEETTILPNPGSLTGFKDAAPGDIMLFRVTGKASGGSVWGTDRYTTDSALAVVAVHAGVLKEGETGIVKVTFAPGQSEYKGSSRNGATSSSWGSYGISYKVELVSLEGEPGTTEQKEQPEPLKQALKLVKLPKEAYFSDESIIVEFSNLPGNKQDWLTITKQGASDNQYGEYFYTQGKKEGSYTFKSLAAGEYEVRVYFNWPDGGYTVQDRLSFKVTAAAAPPAPVQQEPAAEEAKTDHDPIIERMQFELTELGYDPGPIDGTMAEKTTEALKKYQTENNLEVTGNADEATLKKFKIEPPKLTCTSYKCTAENGLTGDMVAQIKTHIGANKDADNVVLKKATNTDLKQLPALNDLLTELTISSSKYVTDITPVGKLTNVKKSLTLEYLNNLTDLTPLENLKDLTYLYLSELGEPLTLQPLAALANLEQLILSQLNVKVAEPFDLSALAGKPLLKNLTIYGTKVKDLSPLQDSTALDRLSLKSITAEDLTPVKAFKKLTYLVLSNIPATDLSPVGELPELKELAIGSTDVTDLSFLSSLKKLKYLTFNNIPAKDMTPVGDLSELLSIDLYETSFDDYTPLAKCTKLQTLTARYEGEGFNNLDVIASMPDLRRLWVDEALHIQKWNALATAVNLEDLWVTETSFSDLSLLKGMGKLTNIGLDECTVTNPEVLGTLPKLNRIAIEETKGITDLTMFRNLWRLPDLTLYYEDDQFPQEQVDAMKKAIEDAKQLQKVVDEQFYDNDNKWLESSSEDSEIRVADGKYVFEHKKEKTSWMTWNNLLFDASQNFSIEATIAKIHGPETSGYGLIWGVKDVDNRYQFLVNGQGGYTYAKTVAGKWEAITDWTASPAVNQGAATNILSIRRLGDQLQLYINYYHIATVPYEEGFGPKVGFFVHGPTKIEIDQILVRGTQAAP